MRKLFAAVTAAAFVVALGAPAFASEMTVKGQIVDQSCYLKDKANTAKNHGDKEDCATACAKKGAPMAIVTDDGKIYQLGGGLAADNNAKIIPHISHTVEVTGEVTEKGGKMIIAADTLKMVKK
jgi:type 1 fimbria pilin